MELTARLAVLIWDGGADGGDKRLYAACLSKLGVTPSDNSRVSMPKKSPQANKFMKLEA